MSSTIPDDIDSEYAVFILKTMSENEELREIKLAAELDGQMYLLH